MSSVYSIYERNCAGLLSKNIVGWVRTDGRGGLNWLWLTSCRIMDFSLNIVTCMGDYRRGLDL
jgi:hypothetical protein